MKECVRPPQRLRGTHTSRRRYRGTTLDRVATRSHVEAQSRSDAVVTQEVGVLRDREGVQTVEESVDVGLELLRLVCTAFRCALTHLKLLHLAGHLVDAFAVPAVLTTANAAITSVTMMNRRIPALPMLNPVEPADRRRSVAMFRTARWASARRVRVLTVPSGAPSRAATSVCERSLKYASSITSRS